jgi:Helix-turn-helix domain (DUF4817)
MGFLLTLINNMFSNVEKFSMFVVYSQCNFNARLALLEYQRRYPNGPHPNKRTFVKLAHNLKNYGSFKKSAVRSKKVVDSVRAQNRVLNYVNNKTNNDQDVSLREIERFCNVRKDSARRILKKHRYRCYRLRKVQHLREDDKPRRLRFCRWILNKKRNDPSFSSKILWSDEANFSNNGFFNRNIHYKWHNRNPSWHKETAFQERFSVNVWLGALGSKLIGPYFYNYKLTAARYLTFLQNNLFEYIEELPLEDRLNFKYFQQDGAPAHNALISRNYLNENYPQKWIGTHGPILWPARSPDITPLDFFIWGYIKDKVYSDTPQNVDDLKQRIREACEAIRPQMIENANKGVYSRARLCIRNHGGHFEHLL